MRIHQNFLLFFLLLPLFAAGCMDQEAQGQMKGSPPPLVEVVTVERADVPLEAEHAAQVDGSREVEVRAQVGGILRERTYHEGTYVEKGEILFRIDPDTYKANLEQAEGQLELQQSSLELARLYRDRTMALYGQGAVSTHERDDAEAQYQSALASVRAARGAVEKAELDLSYTEVRAPISGITSKETRSEGSLVVAGSDSSLLTTITRLDPVYVNYSIPGTTLLKVKRQMAEGIVVEAPGGPVIRLRLADGTLYEHPGELNFMDRHEDPLTGAVRARAEVPNPDGMVLPGSFARVVVQGMYLKDAVVIPQSAVLFTKDANLVYVLDESNAAQPRPVVLGDTVGDGFQIVKGLQGGERIISEGVIKVRPGVVVRTADPKAQAAKEQ